MGSFDEEEDGGGWAPLCSDPVLLNCCIWLGKPAEGTPPPLTGLGVMLMSSMLVDLRCCCWISF